MADIELPQLGESVTEGTITRWFKAVGDEVAEDEPLFEVSTDKVDSEVPSPVAGTLTEILVEEGDTVDVGTKLAVVSAGGEGGGTAPAAEEAPAAEPESAPEPEPEPEPEAQEAAAPEPEPEPAPTPPPEPEPAPKAEAPAPSGGAEGVLLSPVVRKLVEEAGIDPSQVTGTGIGGRITRADVEGYLAEHGAAASTPTAAPSGAAPSRPAPSGPAASAAAAATEAPRRPAPTPTPVSRGEDTHVPFNKIRKITAEHMVRSLDTSAHAYVSVEVDFEGIERVRRAHKDRFKQEEGTSLTYLPFISRALVDAIAEWPNVNASVGDGELIVHGDVQLGIAVDLDHEGLIVPVVHGAQDKRLRALARDIADLADRARNRKLSADDITGGTVTITNIGFTGNVFLLPVINQPQVMILSTDGVRRRPVVVTDSTGSESIAIHSVGNLTLGWDHRAFDGAYAALFLARIREILETRDWEAEL